jgi:phosphatidylserine decarboxylase
MIFRIHKEGTTILLSTLVVLGIINLLVYRNYPSATWLVVAISLVIGILVLQFFRNPLRVIPEKNNDWVYAPCDGRICVMEEVYEPEYFKDRRLQVSIFMSPLNVHVNRNPVGGKVVYQRYHPGKYLVAWHPKSSTENERTTIVYETDKGQLLMRQIAGAVARRIVCYVEQGQTVTQGSEMGFIKFGSRVDLFFPLGTTLDVVMDQVVKGNQTVIGHF